MDDRSQLRKSYRNTQRISIIRVCMRTRIRCHRVDPFTPAMFILGLPEASGLYTSGVLYKGSLYVRKCPWPINAGPEAYGCYLPCTVVARQNILK